MIPQITAQQLAARLKQPNPPQLIDVREAWEFEVAHIPNAHLHTLSQLGHWAQTLPKNGRYVLICHHGGRSQMACQMLQHMGFGDVTNLEGGTDSWATGVDPDMARY